MPSAPLVPQNDPTLMFVNAGMVPFKNVFTGLETRPYSTATSSQKCVRAGGKHNDLDNVGYTARHHTFFEMLGNFSFGDYFKEQAIVHAWTLLTKEWGLPADKLTATVYHTDDQAFDLWKKIAGLPDHRIIRIADQGQFLGDGQRRSVRAVQRDLLRPRRPYPRRPARQPGRGRRSLRRDLEPRLHAICAGGGRDRRRTAQAQSIDTGMGLERVAAVMQGVHDNYDTDTFKALIAASGALTHTATTGDNQASHRVIADHLRTCGLPGRRRRAARQRGPRLCAPPDHAPGDAACAHLLGAKEPLMHRLVPALIAEMGAAYPELVRAQPLIEATLRQEETQFRKTLDRGLKLLDEETAGMAAGATLSGATAFKLYDTFGFPYDLTEDALRTQGFTVDRAGFDAAMAEQKARRPRRVEGLGRQGLATNSGSTWPKRSARPNSPAMPPRKARARCWRSSRTARGSIAPSPATRSN